jgi:DNA-binding transcriptional regulator of glucitol operon
MFQSTKLSARQLLALGWAIVLVLASASGSTAAPPTQVNAFNQVSNNLSNQVDNHVFTIPAGKRLAIDYFSAKGTVPAGDSVSGIHINNPVVHFFVVTAQGTDISGKSVFAAAQSFHTTIGPFSVPTDVVVRMERNRFGPGTEAALAVTLAGQLL